MIYVISRISGEGKDRRKGKGDYYLSEREEEDLRYLAEMNKPVILILNAGGPVELTDILEEIKNIRAVLQISQPGQEGGRAVADVLLGKAVPSGKLTATWAKRYEQYCCKNQYCSKSFHDFSPFLIIKKQKLPFCTEAVKALIFGRAAKE